MKLDRVYTRFFRSFNFDYERRAHSEARAKPWEQTVLGWYPYVQLDVEPHVTAVVGANESGKSHMLDAIELLLTGKAVDRQDFCRYADLYSVEQGERRVSDFAGRFRVESEDDVEFLQSLGLITVVGGDFHYVRAGDGIASIFADPDAEPVVLDEAAQGQLRTAFPSVFRLATEVALPASMPISRLANETADNFMDRPRRRRIIDALPTAEVATTELPNLAALLSGLLSKSSTDEAAAKMAEREFQLGRSLLVDVAKIAPTSFADLDEALVAGREGEVNALIQKMNAAIAKYLNFPKWWAQDREFRLLLSPREREVVFTIHDRTGTDYSFSERSRGLRYFLSYYVQLRAHRGPEGRSELLLLDEPDAYLSGVGQQDLLRILEDFALPESGADGGQVVYVTHSPYLINRNAAHRIRVLDKGSYDEGTRVVTDVSRNHYEPLRSSLGPFVAETAFIGGANLFVEGLADQVLLAGISSYLLSVDVAPSRTLNLNDVTIVPAGSASAIPYLVFLARGRDQVKPPCVVLLDGDKSGKDALKQLARKPVGRGLSIAPEFILSMDVWAQSADLDVDSAVVVEEPEDLIAPSIAAAAARRYAHVVLGIAPDQVPLTSSDVSARLADAPHVWDATKAAFEAALPDEHIEKVGFAREVIEILRSADGSDTPELVADANVARRNFELLLSELADRLRDARSREDDDQQRDRVARLVRAFLENHVDGVTRDLARLAIRDIEKALDDTADGDERRSALAQIRREFLIDAEPTKPVPNYEDFRLKLGALPYQERLAHQDRVIEPASDASAVTSDTVDAELAGRTADEAPVIPAASANDVAVHAV